MPASLPLWTAITPGALMDAALLHRRPVKIVTLALEYGAHRRIVHFRGQAAVSFNVRNGGGGELRIQPGKNDRQSQNGGGHVARTWVGEWKSRSEVVTRPCCIDVPDLQSDKSGGFFSDVVKIGTGDPAGGSVSAVSRTKPIVQTTEEMET